MSEDHPECAMRHLIHTEDWWNRAQELMNLLLPFLYAINNLQSDAVSLHTYNNMIERCRESLITVAETEPAVLLKSAAEAGLTRYNSLRWKPLNNGAQPRQFVRILMIHLKHGLSGSPPIEWIKPFSIFRQERTNAAREYNLTLSQTDEVSHHARDITAEYVDDADNEAERKQAIRDKNYNEHVSKRVINWFKVWAANMLINAVHPCLVAPVTVKELQDRIYQQWLSFVARQEDAWCDVYNTFINRLLELRSTSPNRHSPNGDTFEEQAAIYALSTINFHVEFGQFVQGFVTDCSIRSVSGTIFQS